MTVGYQFKLPDLGEGLSEGEIARWLVEEGQEIAEDDPLVEIATDKTTVEIPSPAAGVVAKILVPAGEIVPVGTVLVVIGGEGAVEPKRASDKLLQTERAAAEPPSGRRAEPRPASNKLLQEQPARATPLVRRLAQELGVDLAAVAGSGPQGRITEGDVRSAAGATAPAVAEGRREPIRGIRRQMF
ncbi:MAG TPA: biotin/lipoyl-containing protein, partial [Gaiellaceae bacterium]|nr:biotin/lipoyl-containing protein [Gaiellaceae bacterium]